MLEASTDLLLAQEGASTSAIGLYLGLLFRNANIGFEGFSVLFFARREQAFPLHLICALYLALKWRELAR